MKMSQVEHPWQQGVERWVLEKRRKTSLAIQFSRAYPVKGKSLFAL
jgi:hypothetical protein